MGELEKLPGRVDQLVERIDRLEVDLRAEIRNGDVMVVTTLLEQIEESRRHARMLHEDVLDRFRLIGETLGVHGNKITAHDHRIDALSGRVDGLSDTVVALSGRVDGLSGRVDALSDKIDAGQDDNRAMFAQILSRLDAPRTPPTRKRR